MIEVVGVTKRYGQNAAVDDLTFDVRAGHVTGFLGPNGAGKSTTMRVIMGFDATDKGRALVNGHPYDRLDWPLREVGAHLDVKAFHPGRSGERHLLALAAANAIDRSRVGAVLDLVGLTSVRHKRAGTFSTGMAQRLGIAAAMLGDPGILLFDEPINGLDPEGIRWFRQLVHRLAAEGRTVLLSSHLISEMTLTADQLVVIGRGHLVAELSMAELTARAPLLVRVRTPEPERLTAVLRELRMTVSAQPDGALSVAGGSTKVIASRAAAAGIPLYELTPEHASLEDLFMQLTNGDVEFRPGASASVGVAGSTKGAAS
jgi:ABC-2 type transport system ATP-binding protein